MNTRIVQFATVFISSIFLIACSSLPEDLKSDNPNIVTDYAAWQQSANSSDEVRVGGVIAKVTNLENRTRIEVVNLPISSSGKPDIKQEPKGRFVGYVDGFADPVTLSEGRLITLLGKADGTEKNKVGEFDYDFPVMAISNYHLWRIEERVIVHDTPTHLYPCRGLYCRDINYGNRSGRVIQEVK